MDFVISLENSRDMIGVKVFSLLVLEADKEENIKIIGGDSPLILTEFLLS